MLTSTPCLLCSVSPSRPPVNLYAPAHIRTGYFSATGPAKKGHGKFLCGSLRRLGPPLLLFWLIINPLEGAVAQLITNGKLLDAGPGVWFFPRTHHCWFLVWLLMFNCGYALFTKHKCGQRADDQQQHDEEHQKVPSVSPSPAPESELTDPVAGSSTTRISTTTRISY